MVLLSSAGRVPLAGGVLCCAAALCLCLSFAGSGLAQPSARDASGSPSSSADQRAVVATTDFSDEITVVEVVLPVQVLLDQEPVSGLERDNFEVWQDGERLPLIGFEVVDLRSSEAQTGEAASSSRAVTSGDRHFLAMFDLAQAPAHRLALAVESMRRMLADQLHPSDRVGVAVLGSGASLLTPLTRDRERVAAALDLVDAFLDRKKDAQREARRRLAKRPKDSMRELTAAVGPAAALALRGGANLDPLMDPALRGVFDDFDRPNLGTPFDSGPLDDFAISRELESLAQVSTYRRLGRAFGELVTLLSQVPGEKYVLYFSNGVAGFESAIQAPLQGSGILATYVELIEAMQRSGWIVQAFDVMGVGQGNPGSLFYLAEETGGELYDNYGRLDVATRKMVERTSVSYRLIFQSPALERDGLYREVDVRLVDAPPRARVTGRLGYRAPKRHKQMTRLERRLQQAQSVFREADREELPARVLLLNTPTNGDRRRLSLVVEISGEDLFRAIPQDSLDRRFSLEITAYAADGRIARYDTGGVVDMLNENLEFPAQRWAGPLRKGFRFVGDLDVGVGEHEVRVRVRDPRSGVAYQTTRYVLGGEASEPSLAAFLLAPDDSGVRAREAGSGVLRDEDSPLVLGKEVLLPSVRTRVVVGERPRLVLRLYGEESQGGDRLSAELRRLDEEHVRALDSLWTNARQQRSADGSRVIATVLDTADLRPGPYRLLLSWLDEEGLRSAAGIELEVVAGGTGAVGGR